MTVLVCDLGGTGCRMALAENGLLRRDTYRSMKNADFKSFEKALDTYLQGLREDTPKSAIIALAAPINSDEIALSNHDWRLSKSLIANHSGIPNIQFINDLEALGHALQRSDQPASLPVQQGGVSDASAIRLVMGVGTGFNSAACRPGESVICSETGHMTFPVETPLDERLQAHFTTRFGRCSMERVLSGSGLGAVYEAVCDETGTVGACSDSHEIIPAALNSDPLAERACAEFCRIFGRAAGDLALAFVPKGGIWLAGGISHALAPMISDPDGTFVKAFRAKGRMSLDMNSFQVRILNDDLAALEGCLACYVDHTEMHIGRHMTTMERAI